MNIGVVGRAPWPEFVRRDALWLHQYLDAMDLGEAVGIEYAAMRSASRVWREVRGLDGVISWFGDWASLVATAAARVHGVPSVVIAGGYDVDHAPEIDYGVPQHGDLGQRVAASKAFEWADEVASVSPYALQRLHEFYGQSGPVVPMAVDTGEWLPLKPGRTDEETPHIVCVAGSLDRAFEKGLWRLSDAAVRMPDAQFHVVGQRGGAPHGLIEHAPANVWFRGWLPDRDLKELMGQADVVVQYSASETFGISVVEGMAAGCVPVVSDRGALPWVVGPHGVVVRDWPDPTALRDGIQEALEDPPRPKTLRRHVEAHFSVERRVAGLIDTLHDAGLPHAPDGERP